MYGLALVGSKMDEASIRVPDGRVKAKEATRGRYEALSGEVAVWYH